MARTGKKKQLLVRLERVIHERRVLVHVCITPCVLRMGPLLRAKPRGALASTSMRRTAKTKVPFAGNRSETVPPVSLLN